MDLSRLSSLIIFFYSYVFPENRHQWHIMSCKGHPKGQEILEEEELRTQLIRMVDCFFLVISCHRE